MLCTEVRNWSKVIDVISDTMAQSFRVLKDDTHKNIRNPDI